MPIKIVFSTINNEIEAHGIASTLVRERLAACVNIIPKITSVYTWKGQLEQSEEALMIIKTQASRLDDLMLRLSELHPYDVPECVAVAVESGHQPYLDWVLSETSGPGPGAENA